MLAEDFLYYAIPLGYLAGVGLALVAISQDRTPQGAIGWALALVLMPAIAIPAFLVFGGWRYRAYRRVRLRARKQLGRDPETVPVTSSLEKRQLGEMRVLEKLARLPFTRGNAARLLIDGEATFAAIFAAIDEARTSVLCQFYLVRDDATGNALAERLAAAAARGVKVCLLYDEVASFALPRAYVRRLKEAGVAVAPFGSAFGFGRRFQVNFRNHRKLTVVDGRMAFTGGLNAGNEYRNTDAGSRYWRDTHVCLSGPAVGAAQHAFYEDWYWATGERLDLDWTNPPDEPQDQTALIIASGPGDRYETYGLLTVQAINSAVERIWIATPYFIPEREIIIALQLAVLRGVDVRILVPKESDNWLVWLANFAWFERVTSDGVKLLHYTRGFMHQKVMLMDDAYAAIGTANMDNRSFSLNFEITAIVADRDFAGEVAAMLERDMAGCLPYDRAEYRASSRAFKLLVRLAHLFSPLL